MTQIQIIPSKVPYAAVVREDLATDGSRLFLAEVPDLPGCMAHGETPQEALQNLDEAFELYLRALDEAGVERPVLRQPPPPTSGTGMNGGVVLSQNGDVDGDFEVTDLRPTRRTA